MFNFPASPSTGQVFTPPGGLTYVWNGYAWAVSIITSPNSSAIIAVIDGSGATITTGLKGYVEVPFNGAFSQVDMVADRSGNIVVDLWKCTFAQFDAGTTHPAAGDKITSSTPPTIIGGVKSTDSVLASWTTVLTAGDIIGFYVTSVLNIQRVTVTLRYNR